MPESNAAPRPTVHFVHVMKTGGTSLVKTARERLGPNRCWPPEHADGAGLYSDPEALRCLDPREREKIRFFSGHLPYVAVHLSGADISMTVLRDPVDRAISLLRQRQRIEPDLAEASLDEIFDDIWKRGMLIWEYQVRQFAKGLDDDPLHVRGLVIDDRAMARAQEHLSQVTVLGLHDRYDEFERTVAEVMGWPHEPFPRLRVSQPGPPASEELRARIAEENPADMEFYRWAVDHYAQRGGPTV